MPSHFTLGRDPKYPMERRLDVSQSKSGHRNTCPYQETNLNCSAHSQDINY
jgi:hypothetical protein